MPVIGRLDEQVGRVLIDPVSKRREPEDAVPAPTHTPPAEKPRGADTTKATQDNEPERGTGEAELPVWLL
jgi:hypothetical protein